jgi:hypothetical protein
VLVDAGVVLLSNEPPIAYWFETEPPEKLAKPIEMRPRAFGTTPRPPSETLCPEMMNTTAVGIMSPGAFGSVIVCGNGLPPDGFAAKLTGLMMAMAGRVASASP